MSVHKNKKKEFPPVVQKYTESLSEQLGSHKIKLGVQVVSWVTACGLQKNEASIWP